MNAESMYQAGQDAVRNFTKDENDALTKVGPATVMGNLFRQYWIPVTPAVDVQSRAASHCGSNCSARNWCCFALKMANWV